MEPIDITFAGQNDSSDSNMAVLDNSELTELINARRKKAPTQKQGNVRYLHAENRMFDIKQAPIEHIKQIIGGTWKQKKEDDYILYWDSLNSRRNYDHCDIQHMMSHYRQEMIIIKCQQLGGKTKYVDIEYDDIIFEKTIKKSPQLFKERLEFNESKYYKQ